MIEQLQQLCTLTWDGNVIGKTHRDWLVKHELAQRLNGGFNLITPKGVQYLTELKLLPRKVMP